MGNVPHMGVDPDGGWSVFVGAAIALGTGAAGYGIDRALGGDGMTGLGIGLAVGAGVGFAGYIGDWSFPGVGVDIPVRRLIEPLESPFVNGGLSAGLRVLPDMLGSQQSGGTWQDGEPRMLTGALFQDQDFLRAYFQYDVVNDLGAAYAQIDNNPVKITFNSQGVLSTGTFKPGDINVDIEHWKGNGGHNIPLPRWLAKDPIIEGVGGTLGLQIWNTFNKTRGELLMQWPPYSSFRLESHWIGIGKHSYTLKIDVTY